MPRMSALAMSPAVAGSVSASAPTRPSRAARIIAANRLARSGIQRRQIGIAAVGRGRLLLLRLLLLLLGGVGLEAVARRLRRVGLALVVGVDDAVIVLRMLVIVLGRDAIAGRRCVARQRQIFLEHLVGIAAHPDIGTIGVERLVPQRHVALLAVRHPAATATATTAAAIALAVTSAPAWPLHMGTLSHDTFNMLLGAWEND